MQSRLSGATWSRDIVSEANAGIAAKVGGLDQAGGHGDRETEGCRLAASMWMDGHSSGAMVFAGHLLLLTGRHAFLLLPVTVSPPHIGSATLSQCGTVLQSSHTSSG